MGLLREFTLERSTGGVFGLLPSAPWRGLVQQPAELPVGAPAQEDAGQSAQRPGLSCGGSSVQRTSKNKPGSGAGGAEKAEPRPDVSE